LLWVVALAVVLRLPTLTTRLFDADEAAIGVQGMVLRDGGTIYRDIFDRKPPLPPLAYAGSFALTGDTDVRLMRVLVTLLLIGGGLLMATEARRRWGTTTHAMWAGTLFVAGAMAMFPADAGGANYAHFALLPATAALLWSRRDRWGWALAAGVAFGLALLTRQSWLVALPPAVYSTWRVGRWRHVGLLFVGLVPTVASVALYAPFDAYWEWNFTNSPGFVLASAGIGISVLRGLASVAGFVGFHATATGCLWCSFRSRNPLRRTGAADRDLWLWLASGLVAVAAGFRFFGHYWLQVLPPLVVLATPVAAQLTGRIRQVAIGGFSPSPVPVDATAVVLNVTVTQPTAASHLTIWPKGYARPTTSSVNMKAGQTVANLVTVRVGAGTVGPISIFNNAGNVHVIADVVGYYSNSD